ncbi:hypothetical protein K239x_01880 [Planctomycetes bacterium K23_9]|uniref:Uncharacterized protein n=1 Tax=Stieleria marina TaxID=1930275 RepID=A0A517NME5_9BACT|nr:hypothetical protein K239x_01880 [Planctomycetes bacterium K23_9]
MFSSGRVNGLRVFDRLPHHTLALVAARTDKQSDWRTWTASGPTPSADTQLWRGGRLLACQRINERAADSMVCMETSNSTTYPLTTIRMLLVGLLNSGETNMKNTH